MEEERGGEERKEGEEEEAREREEKDLLRTMGEFTRARALVSPLITNMAGCGSCGVVV